MYNLQVGENQQCKVELNKQPPNGNFGGENRENGVGGVCCICICKYCCPILGLWLSLPLVFSK